MATDDPINQTGDAEDSVDQELHPDHPMAGSEQPGLHAPDLEHMPGQCAEIVLKRGGVESEVRFPISPPAILGRFDPAVGPVDVDLGSLPEGSYVSRKHAKITCEDGEWKIADLGSANGTFILRSDFERIEEEPLTNASEFALGNARFVFHLTEESPSAE